ncbi:GDSL esterase/lipase At1g28610 [Lactuca sativa]|uniref:Uncharacterized protein n=1 Tax=Lactuca sativa TaxID=4236 RepID=A0A9R1UP75_LACSA|nr:GDSL esterase/lipase At1g28610 [Lactuca sativa]KAJ0191026.1 hypothetical protein LSAT_V11C800451770 [Lactuca sativa]
MAFSTFSLSITIFLMILQVLWNTSMYVNGCYTSIFSFGDSLADTGNIKQIASITHTDVEALRWPYGETFFHQPTGRASNGRLLIDFLAESLGLPLIPPFLHDKEDDKVVEFGQGVNYAVVAATALDTSFHEARGTVNAAANVSLGDQLRWFKQSLPFICNNTSDCRNLIGRSLILMGEIGGTDYNNPIVGNKPIDELNSYVPLVIDTIISAVNELINMGAQTLVVPGTFPIGCSGMILTSHFFEKEEEYDNRTGCLIKFNTLAEYHNELLQSKLNHLREIHPNVIIIYADYYNAAMQIIRSPDKFGFIEMVLKSCCGGGGPYNYNPLAKCGYEFATTCVDPNMYAYWDGIHFTEAAYLILFKSLFQGPYTTPQFNLLCPSSTFKDGVGLSGSQLQ